MPDDATNGRLVSRCVRFPGLPPHVATCSYTPNARDRDPELKNKAPGGSAGGPARRGTIGACGRGAGERVMVYAESRAVLAWLLGDKGGEEVAGLLSPDDGRDGGFAATYATAAHRYGERWNSTRH